MNLDAKRWRQRAREHAAKGDRAAAAVAYAEAAKLAPDDAIVTNGYGTALAANGQLREAVGAFERAAHLRRDWPDPWLNLSLTWQRLGKPLNAAQASRRAGDRMMKAFRHDDARSAYTRATRLAPGDAHGWYGLGRVEQATQRLDAAEAAYRAALAIDEAHPQAWNNLACLLHTAGRFAAAREGFQRSLALRPDARTTWSSLLATMQYDDTVEAADIARAHLDWGRRAAPAAVPWTIADPDPDRPLVVGFISPDFHRHPVGSFLLALFPHLPPGLVPVAYNDRGLNGADDVTARLRAAVPRWHDVDDWSDDELRAQILADRVDVLVDCAGHTGDNRLWGVFAPRSAPVQVTWGGYVGTTGLPTMDWLISDSRQSPPGAEALGSEQIWRLDRDYVPWEPPNVAPPVGPLPARRNGYVTFGSFNNLRKVTDRCLARWAEITLAVPDARLFLKTKQLSEASVVAHVAATLEAAGLPASRFRLEGPTGQAGLLAAYNEVDVGLDSFPYSGGVTTLEALWMGVPVITTPGERFSSRHTLTHVTDVGLGDWVTDDAVARARLAVADLDALAALRASLRARVAAAPVCDGPGFAQDFGEALRGMWRRALGRG